jgi:YHS domain-containing protein
MSSRNLLSKACAAGLLLSCCLSVTWLCAGRVRADAPATTQKAVDPTPVNKNCAVETDQPIDPNVTVVYDGKTYGFCCKDCMATFQKDPAKYAAKAK